jgi:hypothetical protein
LADPAWIYAISQALLEAWVLSIATIVETAIVVPCCGFGLDSLGGDWRAFASFLAVLMPSGCLGSGVVFLCSVLLPSQDIAFAVGSGFVTLGLAVSGAFVPTSRIPDFASWLQWVSPVKYTFQALSIVQLEGTGFEQVRAKRLPPLTSYFTAGFLLPTS